jgi:DNA polymerase-1
MNQARLPFDSVETDYVPDDPPVLAGVDEIGLDCETSGLRWWKGDYVVGIAVAWGDRRTYLPFRHRGGNLDENAVKRWASTELKNKRIVNLNTRFDVHFMREWGVDLEAQDCTFGDVGHYAALLDDHRRTFNLEAIAQRWLKRGKVKGIDPTRMVEYHAAEVAPYAREDAALALDVQAAMWPELTEQELHRVRELEDELIPVVCEMERLGAPLDVEKLHRWLQETSAELDRLLWQIARTTGFQVNPASPEDLTRLFRERKIPVTAYTETGLPSFADDVLEKIEDPVVQDVRRAAKIFSLRTKFLLPFESRRDDEVLRYALHQLRSDDGGTVSGRFSSSRLDDTTGINVQQVPAVEKQTAEVGDKWLVRELFIPKNGLWCAPDAAQIEYRLFAHYASSPRIMAEYAADPRRKFHNITWDMMKSLGVELLYKQMKNVNFAKIYGAGLRKLAVMLGVSVDRARVILAAYDQLFPEVPRLLASAADKATRRGYVKTIIGRRARFINGERAHKALNAVIQGSAADIMKMKLIELHADRKNTGLTMRFTVHDEVDGDVPDVDAACRVGAILDRQSIPTKVPVLWDVATGRNWKECA